MGFDWSSAGSPPAPNELEVTVIGPGFGESIVVHIGDGRWAIIDSCVDTSSTDGYPAPVAYLEALGVDPAQQVDLVVATHWHQDHVRALDSVIRRCPRATFSCAKAMLTEEFMAYLVGTGSTITTSFDSKPLVLVEIVRTLKERGTTARWADPGKVLQTWKRSDASIICQAWALSPSDKEYERFMARVVDLIPKDMESRRAAAPGDPNEVSVVVQLIWPNDVSVLLGADMVVTGDASRGWKAAMVEHSSLALPRSAIVKVPHHGSLNAHYEVMWADGLQPQAIAVVAPYGRGDRDTRPPKQDDLERIASLAPRSYLTSSPRAGARGKFDAAVEKTLSEGGIEMNDANPTLGVVQLRRSGSVWTHKLLPPAMLIQHALR